MNELREQILILIGTPIYALIIGLELFLSNYHHRKLYTWKDTAVNVLLGEYRDLFRDLENVEGLDQV